MNNPYLQRIFNWEWNYFMIRKQRISAGNEFHSAMYYGPDGSRCSIGIFIPEDIYKPAMEGNDVETLLARWPMFMLALMQKHLLPVDTESAEFGECVELLCALQTWHDDAELNGETYVYDVDNVARMNLIEIGRKFNLCCPKR